MVRHCLPRHGGLPGRRSRAARILVPQGGISPRHRRDGTLDCPEVAASTGVVENMGRDIARGLDALQREVERLRERYNRP